MKKIFIILILVFNLVIGSITGFLLFSHFSNSLDSKIVYIDNVKLFNGFNMTKDLRNLNQKKLTAQKKKLDSLYAIYTIFKEQKNEDKAKNLEIQLRGEDDRLREISEFASKESSRQIWDRLHQYIEEYGVSKKYKIVIGT